MILTVEHAAEAQSDLQTRVPFNLPSIEGHERDYVSQAIENWHISGDGPFTRRCQEVLESLLGVRKALLTTSCTHALEMAAFLLRLDDHDEVIVPSFTFSSTATAFAVRGARPVFADIRPDTLNIDERLLEDLITPRTKAIALVHYAGVACEMDTILEIAKRHDVAVVEDNAHGLFAKYRGRYLGSFGSFAAQSFHETKNVTCGEGGALLINDARYCERAEIIREKGTNRSRFFRGLVDKYSWVDLGSSYLPSDLLAAFLYAQLQAYAVIQAKRKLVWERYQQGLSDWSIETGIQLPFVPEHCEQPYHMFYMLLPSEAARDELMRHLKARDIVAVFHYLPLHASEAARALGIRKTDCPVTERVSTTLLRLPFYNNLTYDDQARVIDTIVSFRP